MDSILFNGILDFEGHSNKGVGIKSSRFNHNCSANAELIWNDLKELIEIRTVSKINAGEEITVKYIQGYSKQSVNFCIYYCNYLISDKF